MLFIPVVVVVLIYPRDRDLPTCAYDLPDLHTCAISPHLEYTAAAFSMMLHAQSGTSSETSLLFDRDSMLYAICYAVTTTALWHRCVFSSSCRL